MIVKAVKHRWRSGDSYTVEIKQGVQSFNLDYEGPKTDCAFMARMFRKALKAHDAVVIEREMNRDHVSLKEKNDVPSLRP